MTDQLNDNLFQATNESGCLTIRVVTDVSLSCADGFFNPIKYILSCGYEAYTGCMDVEACNYNPEAIIDDGSCAELDCLGVCGGSVSGGEVCGTCLDVEAVLEGQVLLLTRYFVKTLAVELSSNWAYSAMMWQLKHGVCFNQSSIIEIQAIDGTQGGNTSFNSF